MESSINLAIHFCEFGEIFPKAIQELIFKAVNVCLELDAAFSRLSEVIQRERIVWSMAKAGVNGFVEKGAYIGNESEGMSSREYGERLSWGTRGRPYKPRSYTYIAVFKRNLPYQRRSG